MLSPLPYRPDTGTGMSDIAHYSLLCESIKQTIVHTCQNDARHIFMEDYAYGITHSRSLSSLHEIGGIIKYLLQPLGADMTLISPTRLKKLFTGRGNASKQDMWAAFRKHGYPDISAVFRPGSVSPMGGRKPPPSPVLDLVDAVALIHHGILPGACGYGTRVGELLGAETIPHPPSGGQASYS